MTQRSKKLPAAKKAAGKKNGPTKPVKAEAAKAKPGRPSSFKPEFVTQAQKLCTLGATDIELADFFGVDVRTLYRWKGEHEEFCQALKAGKEASDARVERSLFARANGYEHDEVDIRVVGGEIVQTPIRKYYPPDTTAAIFWLKNRRPNDWRDKTDVNHSGTIGVRSAAEYSDDELAAVATGGSAGVAAAKGGSQVTH